MPYATVGAIKCCGIEIILPYIVASLSQETNMCLENVDFFRETTVRICGTLEIEKALWRCFTFMRDFIPGDEAYLTYYDRGLSVVKVLASADPDGGSRPDLVFPIPPEARPAMDHKEKVDILIMNDPVSDPIFKHAMHYWGREFSALLMPLRADGEFLGSFFLISRGLGRYAEQHSELLKTVSEPFTIALVNSLRHLEVLQLKDLLADDNRYLQNELRQATGEQVIGGEFGLKGVMELARQVAHRDSPVLLMGETGVGKEVIANFIHTMSPRREGPFIKVNCGAIPSALMDSELFGHEKGSFTGALSQKRGRFERSHGGTIFLDEIGELTAEAQVRLLRVLQEKEIERLGGTDPITVDIRVIAATHRDLPMLIEQERFRLDLYFRLKVFPIVIPPLRERRSDIPSLVQHFMSKKSREMGLTSIPSLALGAIDRLIGYDWPGNVRELENAVERALILSTNGVLTFDEFQASRNSHYPPESVEQGQESLLLDHVVSRHIQHVLRMTNGRVEGPRGAGTILGVKPGTLRHKMRKLGIPFGRKAWVN